MQWLLLLQSMGSREHGLSSCSATGLTVPRRVRSSQTRDQSRLLHWQTDSQPLDHQGSPGSFIISTHSGVVCTLLFKRANIKGIHQYTKIVTVIVFNQWSHFYPLFLFTVSEPSSGSRRPDTLTCCPHTPQISTCFIFWISWWLRSLR